jgi:hypothetical protein
MAIKRWFSMVSSLLLGALPLGARAFADSAAADDPTSAAAADATAQQYRDEADWLKSLGGVGYKTGLVQSAEANAVKYEADAAALRSPEAPQPMTPEAEHYAKLADQYRAIGGAGYKTGLVQRAEADQRRAQEAAGQAAPTTPQEVPCDVNKPAADIGVECTGPE